MTDLKRTPLYDEHVRAGGKMVEFAGYEMPIQYPTGIVAEHRAVRTNAGLFDLSHMGEFFFTGDGAGAAIDRMVSSDIAGLAVGEARYGLLTNEKGTIVDDVIVYRLADDEYLMVVNAANIAKDHAHVQQHLPAGVGLDDRSAEMALIAIQGPRAPTILSTVTDLEVREQSIEGLPFFGVTRARVAGSRAIVGRPRLDDEAGQGVRRARRDRGDQGARPEAQDRRPRGDRRRRPARIRRGEGRAGRRPGDERDVRAHGAEEHRPGLRSGRAGQGRHRPRRPHPRP